MRQNTSGNIVWAQDDRSPIYMCRSRAGCKDRPVYGKMIHMLSDIHALPVLRCLIGSVKMFRRDIGKMELHAKIVFAAAQVPSIFHRSLGGLHKRVILYIRVKRYVNDPIANLLLEANKSRRIIKKISSGIDLARQPIFLSIKPLLNSFKLVITT